MQGFNIAFKRAIKKVSVSLNESTPVNIDQCINGYRFIVETSGNEKIELVKAEILDSDWQLDSEATNKFEIEVLGIIQSHNAENSELLSQAIEIQKDRLEYF